MVGVLSDPQVMQKMRSFGGQKKMINTKRDHMILDEYTTIIFRANRRWQAATEQYLQCAEAVAQNDEQLDELLPEIGSDIIRGIGPVMTWGLDKHQCPKQRRCEELLPLDYYQAEIKDAERLATLTAEARKIISFIGALEFFDAKTQTRNLREYALQLRKMAITKLPTYQKPLAMAQYLIRKAQTK